MPAQKLPPRQPQQAQQHNNPVAATHKPKPGTAPTGPRTSARKLPPKPSNDGGQSHKPEQSRYASQSKHQLQPTPQPQAVPEKDVKQSSSVSASYALDAGKKAYELRQAAAAAGDPDAREQILAKAINKEIEAESFGKAAKYTRSGAFQGLAAGAGIGIQPGATLGTATGAIVGGLLSSVGAIVGGGIGSAYGAIRGPMWDIGGIASHGVRGVVGDFIGDWPDMGQATQHQKATLEKMVLGAKNTKPPDQGELEGMAADDGGADQESYMQFAQDMTKYLPSMDSMPNFETISQSLPSLSSIPGMSGAKMSSETARTNEDAETAKRVPTSQSQGSVGRKTEAPPKLPKRARSGQPSASQSRAEVTGKRCEGNKKPGQRSAAPKLGPRRQIATAGA